MRIRLAVPPLVMLAVLALAGAAQGGAKTIQVNTTVDHDDNSCSSAPGGDCTLREAIHVSKPGDRIDVPAGTYQLGSVLAIHHALTIAGHGPATTTITANGSHRVMLIDGGAQVLRGLTITGGNAESQSAGGGIYDGTTRLLKLEGARVTDNRVSFDRATGATGAGGGGIFSKGPVEVDGGSVDSNHVFLGFDRGVSRSGGGGIYATGALTLRNTELHNNIMQVQSGRTKSNPAAADGGGAAYALGPVTATGSTVAQNNATVTAGLGTPMKDGGGGIYANGGNATITNSTFWNNAANIDIVMVDNGGAGLYSRGGATKLTSVTLKGNSTAGGTGGGVYREGGSVTLRNTILAANSSSPSSGAGSPDNCAGGVTSAGHNLESANTCGLNGPGDMKNRKAKLGTLASNGGPTRTLALGKGSPAIDAALNCPATDQRGVRRPRGTACDIGSFEANVPNVATGAAKNVKPRAATLNGTVNPGGRPTSYVFRYGTTKAYGSKTPATAAGSGRLNVPAAFRVKGLKPGTIYHYRLFATNSAGTESGADRTFKTAAG
jgi:CSLREA domain-containing protein